VPIKLVPTNMLHLFKCVQSHGVHAGTVLLVRRASACNRREGVTCSFQNASPQSGVYPAPTAAFWLTVLTRFLSSRAGGPAAFQGRHQTMLCATSLVAPRGDCILPARGERAVSCLARGSPSVWSLCLREIIWRQQTTANGTGLALSIQGRVNSKRPSRTLRPVPLNSEPRRRLYS